MIILDQVVKHRQRGNKPILSAVSLVIPTNRSIALLGISDEDKHKVIDVLAGVALVQSGRVVRKAEISFPVGSFPGYDSSFSIRKNVEHAARIYGADPEATVEKVKRALNIGERFNGPLNALPRDQQKSLMQVVPFCIPFDTYLLVSEKLGANFGCWELFQACQRSSGMIISTSKLNFAKDHCDMAMVLFDGQLALFDRVDDGLALMESLKSNKDK